MNIPIFVVRCEKVSKRKSSYYLSFPYNEQLVERIKSFPSEGRKWQPSKKVWELRTWALIDLIKKYKGSNKIRFDFDGEENKLIFIQEIEKIKEIRTQKREEYGKLVKKKEEWIELKDKLEKEYKNYIPQVHKPLKDFVKLYPFQVVGTMFLDITRNCLLALDMGLGKTLISITYCEINNFQKVLVITPNSLKFNYYNEVEKFTESKAHIVNWKKNKYSIEESKYIILNYEFFNPKRAKKKSEDRFLKKWNELGVEKINTVILDECHRVKNTKSNTYRNFKRITNKDFFIDRKVSKIFMSGTPMKNRAYELYSILNQISPLDFPRKSDFEEQYCGIKYDKELGTTVYDITETRFEELFQKIAPYVYRKRKEEVLHDLPEKTYQKVIFELNAVEQKTYNDIAFNTTNMLRMNPSNNPLTIMIRLRQYLSSLKVKHCLEIVESILETDEKIVIVDYYKESLYKLKEMLGDVAGLHTGDQSVEERNEIVESFQDKNGKLKVFLGSIQTCNYGLTLTAASKLFIITLPYSVGEYDQVSDRLHRIGQKNAVNIYPLIFRDTVDEITYWAIENKRTEIMKVLDNEEYVSDVQESVLNDVLYNLKKTYGN